MPVATVTGATGFLASELVAQLLGKGYDVRATVRSMQNVAKLHHLQELSKGAPGKLSLHAADLTSEGSFDAPISGAKYVFHVASPFTFPSENIQQTLIDPAVKGTENVMRAAAKTKDSLVRVITTSSCAAIYDKNLTMPKKVGAKYTESDWNDVSDAQTEAYWLSKVLAEKAAWAAAKEQGLDLVTICPNFILGPCRSAAESSGGSISTGFIKTFLEPGSGGVPEGDWTICDVRDVAAAHIAAAEIPEASGRYIISQPHSICAQDITTFIKRHFPMADIPDGKPAPVVQLVDPSKASRELGVSLRPVEETIVDAVNSLLALEISKPSWYSGDGIPAQLA